MTREEHLEWAKARALKYIVQGDVINGVASMMSDMTKHDELKTDPDIWLGVTMRTVDEARRWVEAFR